MPPFSHETASPASPSHLEIPADALGKGQDALDAFHERVEGDIERTLEVADALRMRIRGMYDGVSPKEVAERRLRAQVALLAIKRSQTEN